jgi:hypothetical protein
MNGVIKFYLMVIKLALILAFAGVLKEATLAMAGHAAKAQMGMISYSKYTRMLTGREGSANTPASSNRRRRN